MTEEQALSQREKNRLDKEKRILDAALAVFSQAGYSGTSMDTIATEAGVSKPTLYQYFGDKAQLFARMLLQQRDSMLGAFDQFADGEMVAQLHAFAWDYAAFVLRPDMLSLARLIIGEVQRFPEIGPAYQASGPNRLLTAIMTQLERYRDDGRLVFDDAELAAQDFWGLILSAPRTTALYEPENVPQRAELQKFIDNGLQVFLKAYSARPEHDLASLQQLIDNTEPH